MNADASLTAAVADVIREALAVGDAQIRALAERVARLETAPPTPRWLGIWRERNEYLPGDLVTHSGGLWPACRPTSARPGTTDSGFTLVVKAGSYGPRVQEIPA